MKRLVTFLFLFAIGFSMFAQKGTPAQKPQKMNITVKLRNYPDSLNVLQLGYYFGTTKYRLDTAIKDKKGNFVFTRDSQPHRGMFFIYSQTNNLITDLIIDKEPSFSIDLDVKNPYEGYIIKGSEENQLMFDSYSQRGKLVQEGEKIGEQIKAKGDDTTGRAAMYAQLESLRLQFENLNDSFLSQHPDNLVSAIMRLSKQVDVPEAPALITDSVQKNQWRYEYFRNHYFDNIDFQDPRLVYTSTFDDGQRFNYYLDKMIPPFPDSLYVAIVDIIERARGNKPTFQYLLSTLSNKYGSSEVMGHDVVWVRLAEKYYLSGDADWISPAIKENFQKQVNRIKPTMLGAKFPEVYFVDTTVDQPHENIVSIYSGKRRYTVIIFWEPSCGHCQKELPKLKTEYEQFGKELNFEVFAICMDSDIAKWKKYIRDNEHPWISLYGYKATRTDWKDLYDIVSTPTVFVLDENKNVIARRIGVEQIPDYLKYWTNTHPLNGVKK